MHKYEKINNFIKEITDSKERIEVEVHVKKKGRVDEYHGYEMYVNSDYLYIGSVNEPFLELPLKDKSTDDSYCFDLDDNEYVSQSVLDIFSHLTGYTYKIVMDKRKWF